MKKCVLSLITIILILAIILLPLSIATSSTGSDNTDDEDTEEFFEVSETEISVGSTLEMIIDLTQIDYSNFKFELVSSSDISTTKTENEDVDIESSDDNTITIEVDKSNSSFDEIILTYVIPDSLSVGDTLTLEAVVTNLDDKTQTMSVTCEVTIVEETSETNASATNTSGAGTTGMSGNNDASSALGNAGSSGQNSNGDSMKSSEMNNSSSMSASNSASADIKSASMSGNSENTVTYNGSSNNYLKALAIDGFDIDSDFSKERLTYFLTVDNDTTSIDITATAESSSATVCIYGDSDLKTGENKVLISVTAKNGNVRTYIIYVTRAES